MDILNRLFPEREVDSVLNVLDEFELTIRNKSNENIDLDVENPVSDLARTYIMVKKLVKEKVLNDSTKIVEVINQGRSPRELAYTLIAMCSRMLVASGEFHIYFGILAPLGPGRDLLQIFDLALDQLKSIGEISEADAKEYKTIVLKEIEEVG